MLALAVALFVPQRLNAPLTSPTRDHGSTEPRLQRSPLEMDGPNTSRTVSMDNKTDTQVGESEVQGGTSTSNRAAVSGVPSDLVVGGNDISSPGTNVQGADFDARTERLGTSTSVDLSELAPLGEQELNASFLSAAAQAADIEAEIRRRLPEISEDPSNRVPIYSRYPEQWHANPHEKFLYPCIAGGRHNNEFVSFGKAWSLAYHSKRTLVLPSFYQGLNTSLPGIPVEALYNLSAGPVKVVPEAAVFPKGVTRKALCIGEFHGYCDSLWYRKAVHCSETHKRWLRHQPKQNVQFLASLVDKPLLAIGKLYFTKVPPPCMWKYVQPVNAILATIHTYMKALPKDYVAVHLRKTFDLKLTPQEKCREEMNKYQHSMWVFSSRFKFRTPNWDRVLPGCLPSVKYVKRFAPRVDSPFYLAWDGQKDMLPYKNQLVRGGAAAYQGPYSLSSLSAMLVDFWLCVHAGTFVGNFYSSMSTNICSIRGLMGKSCPNMPDLRPNFPCFPLQDLIYSHGQRVKRTIRSGH